MRTDYILYLLAAVFFLMTLSSLLLMSEQVPKSIWVLSTVVLGLFSVGLGYSQRPKAKTEPCQPVLPMPQTETVVVGETRVTETYAAKSAEEPVATQTEESPAVVMHVDSPLSIQAEVSTPEVMRVKGIGEKRAAQLEALGINSLSQLASVSAEDLARDLKISPKITAKWVTSAKDLAK